VSHWSSSMLPPAAPCAYVLAPDHQPKQEYIRDRGRGRRGRRKGRRKDGWLGGLWLRGSMQVKGRPLGLLRLPARNLTAEPPERPAVTAASTPELA
jgi:hypothetical protein